MNAKMLGWGTAGVGIALAAVSILADTLELGSDPTAFGWKQILGVSIGGLLIIGGVVWQSKGSKS